MSLPVNVGPLAGDVKIASGSGKPVIYVDGRPGSIHGLVTIQDTYGRAMIRVENGGRLVFPSPELYGPECVDEAAATFWRAVSELAKRVQGESA